MHPRVPASLNRATRKISACPGSRLTKRLQVEAVSAHFKHIAVCPHTMGQSDCRYSPGFHAIGSPILIDHHVLLRILFIMPSALGSLT